LAERGQLASVGDKSPLRKKTWEIIVKKSGCGWLCWNPKSTENLRKTQKDGNLLKTKRILKSKY